MEKKLKNILVGILMTMMLMGGVLSAQADTKNDATTAEKPKVFVTRCITASPPLSEIQYQKFISYLTGEYAPELKAEWEKAFADRKAIVIPVENNLSSVEITGSSKADVDNIKFGPITFNIKPGQAGKDSIVEGIFTTDMASKEGNILSVTLPKDTDKAFSEASGVVSVTIPQNENKIFAEQFKLQDELDRAIENNDATAIKEVLGIMLANYKEISEDKKSSLSKVEINKADQ